ncbi:hypothetical protein SISNIDRAFT_491005 [Sistotremastrum niveocremeum HHB9708]|uniref:Uncharacterized protein n=1 Tax=Sistotremastrum niveocremeum HHB9708 TaxID=1314777 RepID=A0A164NBE9_9AGAM|nr:hypothetical protein SISNIDRAFT_491005 [Sistotremastrum niveocremeum HHB9708]
MRSPRTEKGYKYSQTPPPSFFISPTVSHKLNHLLSSPHSLVAHFAPLRNLVSSNMFARSNVLSLLFIFLAAAFTIVHALPAPVPAALAAPAPAPAPGVLVSIPTTLDVAIKRDAVERDLVLVVDIFTDLGLDVNVVAILTSICKPGKSNAELVGLINQLLTALGLGSKAILGLDPSKYDEKTFTTLVANLVINLQSVLGGTNKDLATLLHSTGLDLSLDKALASILSSSNKVYAGVSTVIGLHEDDGEEVTVTVTMAFTDIGSLNQYRMHKQRQFSSPQRQRVDRSAFRPYIAILKTPRTDSSSLAYLRPHSEMFIRFRYFFTFFSMFSPVLTCTLVYARAVPPPDVVERDIVIKEDICSGLNVSVKPIVTSFAENTSAKKNYTTLITSLVTQFTNCSEALKGRAVNPSIHLYDRQQQAAPPTGQGTAIIDILGEVITILGNVLPNATSPINGSLLGLNLLDKSLAPLNETSNHDESYPDIIIDIELVIDHFAKIMIVIRPHFLLSLVIAVFLSTVFFTAVHASAIPSLDVVERDSVIEENICPVNVSISPIITSLAESVPPNKNYTALLTSLVTQLNNCTDAIKELEVNPSRYQTYDRGDLPVIPGPLPLVGALLQVIAALLSVLNGNGTAPTSIGESLLSTLDKSLAALNGSSNEGFPDIIIDIGLQFKSEGFRDLVRLSISEDGNDQVV